LHSKDQQNRERILNSRIARRDQVWAGLREYHDYLELLIGGKKPAPFDFLLFYRCVDIVLNEIDLYYYEILNVPQETRELMKDNSAAGLLIRTAKEAKNIRVIDDEQKSVEEKQKAIVDLRSTIWGFLLYMRNDISEMGKKLPVLTDDKDIFLLYQCLSTILLELELADIEVKILRDDF
jgi:hypothetical protein